MSLLYYIIDTETTGLSESYHEMTEIGIVRYSDRVQLWRNIKCEYPERANFDALAITRKTMADLEKGYSKEQVVEACDKMFAEDGATPAHRCIVSHNAQFDRKFLHALWEKCGKQFPANLWIDTIALTKQFLKTADHSKINLVKTATGRISTQLHACCDMLQVKKLSLAHTAKVDSRNTYLLFRNLIEEKKVDHLPFIKTNVHNYQTSSTTDDDIDMSILDSE